MNLDITMKELIDRVEEGVDAWNNARHWGASSDELDTLDYNIGVGVNELLGLSPHHPAGNEFVTAVAYVMETEMDEVS